MRCLYCGKELALLKRLTGGGDFCSDAHKQSYQEEYNRLALSRLLQAQKKGQDPPKPPAQNAPPPPTVTVALEEEPAPERVHEEAPRRADAVPVMEVSLDEDQAEVVSEASADAVAEEEPISEEAAEEAAFVSEEPEPLETAGFLFESPSVSAAPEETPYLETPYVESWLELSSGPAMSEWQLQNGAVFTLSSADLLALDLHPNPSGIEARAFPADLAPQYFVGVPPDPPVSVVAKAKNMAATNRWPTGGVIALDVAPSFTDPIADQSSVQPIGFETTVLLDDSELLELPPTPIDFPAEDSDLVVLARGRQNGTAPGHKGTELETEAPETTAEDNSPRASLDALSRLHQELAEHEATPLELPLELKAEEPPSEDSPAVEAAPPEVVQAATVEVTAPPETTLDEKPDADPEIVQAVAEVEALAEAEAVVEKAKPKFITELFEVSIRTFPPAKPSLLGGDVLQSNVAPLLPHLNSLPLRPKVALAPGYVPPSAAAAPSETQQAAPAAPAVRPQSAAKPASGGKPSARLTQPKQPNPPAKPAQPVAAKVPESRTPTSPKPALAKAEATKPALKSAPSQPTPVQETSPVDVKDVTPKVTPVEKEQLSKSPSASGRQETAPRTPAGTEKTTATTEKAAATDKEKPPVETAKPPQAKPAPGQAKPSEDQTNKDDVPHFGIAQPGNSSWFGSLKVKLGLAILILVIACAYFLGWGGGKPNKSATSNSSVSADGSGPSIIMGEGGWVEGWGGDPTGLHAGRQITIYRPSLKLSDYRLEFQGSIDAKSVGWVFRAADPENYYAMKLMTVSSGLSPKVALFKYLVANGKQTQVGRVPIDLAVQQDSVFNVRVDVRGAQFTTYIQGQQVDSWTDDQLKIGGAGFLNEREERGKVKSVSIRYLSGAAK
jgi:hypothetical protein